MGDPKKHRKKYSTPSHPWQAERLEEERKLVKEYGFKNKTELWKMVSFLRKVTAQAKKLITLTGDQADKEKELLLQRLKRYGLLTSDASLDKILSISLRDVLERRLQTQVYKKKLANSVKQSRQFITHKHVMIGDKIITSPSYILTVEEESKMSFRETSSVSDPEHPERVAALNQKEVVVQEEDDNDTRGRRRAPQKRQQRKPLKRAPPKK